MWRRRVGVEPTILAAKDRINGFEGHEGHRTPFASDVMTAKSSNDGFTLRNRAQGKPDPFRLRYGAMQHRIGG